MRIAGTIFLCLLLSCFCQAQVIGIENLYFHSEYEEKAFLNLESGDSNYLELMLAASGNAGPDDFKQASIRIENLVAELNPKKIQRYSPKKKVKKIFKAVHEDLLLKYELENQFHSVFINGNYNCVSGSMIYALVLDEFGIEHVITETPDHVYLIAVFDEDRIVMEGTDPQSGYIVLTEKLYQEQLRQLVAQELLSEEDLQSPDLEEKLNEIFPSEDISIRDLVSVQYYNQSVYDYNNSRYYEAYENAKKAHYLSPRLRNDAMLYSIIATLVDGHNYLDTLYPEYLAIAYNLDTLTASRKLVQEEIKLCIYNGIIENEEVELVDELVVQCLHAIDDSALSHEIGFYHNLVLSEYQGKKGRSIEQYRYAGKALRSKPKDVKAVDNYIAALGTCVITAKFDGVLDTIRNYHQHYPALHANNYWTSIYAEAVLQEAFAKLGESYSNNVGSYFQEFEDLFEAFPNSIVSQDLIANAYARQALKHFNKSKPKALQTLGKGLGYAPNHPQLVKVRNMIR